MKPNLWLKRIIFFSYIQCFWAKCFNDPAEIERHFYVDEFDLPLRIEVSNRISHQIVSNIAKVLLNEVVGYLHVNLVPQGKGDNATQSLQKISNCSDTTRCQDVNVNGPEVMINLEVWLNPGFNMEGWIATGRVEDLGPLGPIGRSGWYIAQFTVEYFWESNNTIIDHWRAFTNPDIAKEFDLTNGNFLDSFSIKQEDCEFRECGMAGIYRPQKCQKSNSYCATLLADYPDFLLKRIIFKFAIFFKQNIRVFSLILIIVLFLVYLSS